VVVVIRVYFVVYQVQKVIYSYHFTVVADQYYTCYNAI